MKNFIPFGDGARYCMGVDLTKLQMAMFLHELVTKYRYKYILTTIYIYVSYKVTVLMKCIQSYKHICVLEKTLCNLYLNQYVIWNSHGTTSTTDTNIAIPSINLLLLVL